MSNTAQALATTLSGQLASLPTKSAQIRWLDSEGYSRGAITKIMSTYWLPLQGKEVRYQHVKNVLDQKYNGEVIQPKVQQEPTVQMTDEHLAG